MQTSHPEKDSRLLLYVAIDSPEACVQFQAFLNEFSILFTVSNVIKSFCQSFDRKRLFTVKFECLLVVACGLFWLPSESQQLCQADKCGDEGRIHLQSSLQKPYGLQVFVMQHSKYGKLSQHLEIFWVLSKNLIQVLFCNLVA